MFFKEVMDFNIYLQYYFFSVTRIDGSDSYKFF